MFAACIYLRYKDPDQTRVFRIPGGQYWGAWLVNGAGILGSAVTFMIGFVPPSMIGPDMGRHYALLIAAGLVIACTPPFLMNGRIKKRLDSNSIELLILPNSPAIKSFP